MANDINRAIQSLADITSMQGDQISRLRESQQQSNDQLREQVRESNQQLNASMEAGNRQLVSRIDDLAVKIGEQSQSIDRLTGTVDRLTGTVDRMAGNIDRLALSVDGHLRVAEQQALTAMELSKLVATQAATVNKFLDRVAA